MQFLSLITKRGYVSCCNKKIAKIKFYLLKAVKSLQNFLNSTFPNIYCSFVHEKSTYLENYQRLRFSRLSRNHENGLKCLVALTPSTEIDE